MSTTSYLLVALGGAFGSVSRVMISRLMPETLLSLPIPIMSINILGCFLIGFISHILAIRFSSPLLSALLVPGFLGGFTTFSSFALEWGLLHRNNQTILAFIYLFISVAGAIFAFLIGLKLARLIN